jgi:L-ascorbate metabolism protein UlaG (beta-lactamase superfamily)
MLKYLLILFVSFSSHGAISFKWLGTTTFALSDGKTTLIFDPSLTYVSVLDFLPWRKIQTDPSEVDYWFNRCGINKVDAVFVNHAHFDHVIDAPYVVKRYGGKLYGSSSTANVGLGGGLKKDQVEIVRPGKEVRLGEFTIEFFNTPHSPHLWDVMLADGHITAPLIPPVNVLDYRVGDTLSFLIKHPKGLILYQSIGRVDSPDPLKEAKADILLLTLANRRSSEELIDGRVLRTGVRKVIPLHHDNFLLPKPRDGSIKALWGQKLDEFESTMKTRAPLVVLTWPKYCEKITLFEQIK